MKLTNFKNLKIGNKVRVKSNLTPGLSYAGIGFIRDMSEFKGKKVTIVYIDNDSIGIKEDNGKFIYSYLMIDPIFKFGRNEKYYY